MRELARLGVDMEMPRDNGGTPLWVCAKRGHTDLVRFLVGGRPRARRRLRQASCTSCLFVRCMQRGCACGLLLHVQ